MEAIKVEDVKQVYSGKDGKCCCGCAGKHYFPSALAEAVSKSHGYQVTASDSMVRRVVNIINQNLTLAEQNGEYREYVEVVLGSRLYIAYLS